MQAYLMRMRMPILPPHLIHTHPHIHHECAFCILYTGTCIRLHTFAFRAAVSDELGKKWSATLHQIRVQPFTDQPGPTHHLVDDAQPLEFFGLFWEPCFFELLAEETNLYAQQKQATKPERKWYPTTAEEMRAFVGGNIIMGIDHKPELANFWSTDEYLGNEGVKRVFPREQFELLTWYFHLHDSSLMPGRSDPHYDPLYKIRPLIQFCQQNFPRVLVPGRKMSIDEGMIRYKGRVFFRQYMLKKPIKWGIKVWTIADAKSGYVSNFNVYLGKSSAGPTQEHGLSTQDFMLLQCQKGIPPIPPV